MSSERRAVEALQLVDGLCRQDDLHAGPGSRSGRERPVHSNAWPGEPLRLAPATGRRSTGGRTPVRSPAGSGVAVLHAAPRGAAHVRRRPGRELACGPRGQVGRSSASPATSTRSWRPASAGRSWPIRPTWRAPRVTLTFEAARPQGPGRRASPPGDAPKVAGGDARAQGPRRRALPRRRLPVAAVRAGRRPAAPSISSVAGEIALHGVTRPVTLPVHVEARGRHA